ncbi:MAG: class II glutamine amidotransferase [Hyphomicrobiaceae bacterium]|nr:MAG: class II glutamine amidotransferase [Hyphomicrobiaceae bacterium]
MCELFALSASSAVDVRLSLHELARHGGETGIHGDGWGAAFLQDRDVALFREPTAAARSPWITCLETHPVRSGAVLAHIRHATRGAVALENTQPFVRELWGRAHVFAHNGDLGSGLIHRPVVAPRYRSIGETDSEAAFCLLLERLATTVDPTRTDAAAVIFETFAAFVREMREHGPANVIYVSGSRLLVHADRRTQAPGVIEPPGLWLLERHCGEGAKALVGEGVHVAGRGVDVTLVASVPLTGEPWRPLEQGSVLELEHGRLRRAEQV